MIKPCKYIVPNTMEGEEGSVPAVEEQPTALGAGQQVTVLSKRSGSWSGFDDILY